MLQDSHGKPKTKIQEAKALTGCNSKRLSSACEPVLSALLTAATRATKDILFTEQCLLGMDASTTPRKTQKIYKD